MPPEQRADRLAILPLQLHIKILLFTCEEADEARSRSFPSLLNTAGPLNSGQSPMALRGQLPSTPQKLVQRPVQIRPVFCNAKDGEIPNDWSA